jgi:hypothetical protein
MKTLKFIQFAALLMGIALVTASCQYDEDPGPIQTVTEQHALTGFDRLDMGDALHVTVVQGAEFSIEITGDQRNLEDLVVKKVGGTLDMRYKNGWRFIRQRQYPTYVTVTMPEMLSADFSGAVTASVSGFETDIFHLSLSGASDCDLNITAGHIDFDLSGASDLAVVGSASTMRAALSGASRLSALEFPVQEADIDATGASTVKVNASQQLKVSASGASDVIFRGTPAVQVSTSGSSTVHSE